MTWKNLKKNPPTFDCDLCVALAQDIGTSKEISKYALGRWNADEGIIRFSDLTYSRLATMPSYYYIILDEVKFG